MLVFSICRGIPLVVVDGVILWLACEEYAAMSTNMHHTTVSLPTSYVFLLKVCETPIWAAFKFASAIQCVPNHSCAHAIQLV